MTYAIRSPIFTEILYEFGYSLLILNAVSKNIFYRPARYIVQSTCFISRYCRYLIDIAIPVLPATPFEWSELALVPIGPFESAN